MTRYDDFLNIMQQEYREHTGFDPDNASDAGIRLKVLAAQLAALERGITTLEQQVFPQTATGQQLDYHAATRGIYRKRATASSGVLRFARTTPAPSAVVIPAGTICTAADATTDIARFETTEDAVISTGSLTADASARAVRVGADTNAAPGSITAIITPVQSVSSVSNPTAFAGGTDAESDDLLRARLLQSYTSVSNGVNAAFYYDYAMSFNGVASAQVIPRANGIGTVTVYLASQGATADSQLIERVRQGLASAREIGVNVTVASANTQPIAVSIEAAGSNFASLRTLLEERISTFFRQLAVGKRLLLADLAAALYGTEGLTNFHILAPTSDQPGKAGTLLTLGTVTITQMEVVL